MVDFGFPGPGQPSELGPIPDVNSRAAYPVLVLLHPHRSLSFFPVLWVFLHQPFSIPHLVPCGDGGCSSIAALCLSPSPAQGDVLFQAPSYSPSLFDPCFQLPPSCPTGSVPVLFKSITNFHLKSVTDVTVMAP